jgi:two-component system, sensor histidine kinase and response regulator
MDGHAVARQPAAPAKQPVRQGELRELILRLIEERESPDAVLSPYSLVNETKGELQSVLIAEDNPVNQRLIARMLEKRGYQVVIAGNGRESLDALRRKRFDLVFMDVQMPVMDGFEATGEQRRREKLAGLHTPIIALTAHAMKGDRERCLDAGMDEYLTKPINARELDELLAKYARTAAAAQTVPAREESSS